MCPSRIPGMVSLATRTTRFPTSVVLHKGVHYAIGYCGTGVSRSTFFGHKVALKVLGHPEGATAFDDLDFPPFPVQPVAKYAVPVVETWYRLRDAANI
jgi:hypothetical protein